MPGQSLAGEMGFKTRNEVRRRLSLQESVYVLVAHQQFGGGGRGQVLDDGMDVVRAPNYGLQFRFGLRFCRVANQNKGKQGGKDLVNNLCPNLQE